MPNQVIKKSSYTSLKNLVSQKQIADTKANQYVTREFQDYGYQLAEKLNDLQHKALYIKLAKSYPRSILERAYSFVSDYPHAQNKGRLFMWKLKQLREELKFNTKANSQSTN